MIKSMTGFGRGELVTDDCKVTVEIKAVNHRYCDINIKLPKVLNYLEGKLRGSLKKTISRGKVDVYISYEDLSERTATVRLNKGLSREYYNALQELSEQLEIPNTITAIQIGRLQEVMSLEDQPINQEHVEEEVMAALTMAADQFAESKSKEGNNLKEDILEKLDGLLENITEIEKRYPDMVNEYRQKLLDKVHTILGDANIDENRIATEVVIYSDKICVDEETVRLRSHIGNMRDVLTAGGSVGRKLDFIAQEMNREANTILSKANDISISNRAIDLKTEIEKIREQVQNIE